MKAVHRHSRSGFSLVEMLLALLVIGIGGLALIGILADSLNAGEKAVDDTVVALFAEQTLNSIAAQVSLMTNTWDNWSESDVRAASAITEVVADPMWDAATDANVNVGGNVNRYIASGIQIEDFAVRCELEIQQVPGDADRMQIVLRVSSGEFGGKATVTNVYYREVFNTRK